MKPEHEAGILRMTKVRRTLTLNPLLKNFFIYFKSNYSACQNKTKPHCIFRVSFSESPAQSRAVPKTARAGHKLEGTELTWSFQGPDSLPCLFFLNQFFRQFDISPKMSPWEQRDGKDTAIQDPLCPASSVCYHPQAHNQPKLVTVS